MPQHVMSEHLLAGEVKIVEKLLGSSCCKAMGIAELAMSPIQSTVLTEKIHKFEWKSIIKPGMVCFITDPGRNNDYYIQAFDIDKRKRVWEQKIDLQMKYSRRRQHLITFDGAYGTICLNFIDNDEADKFAWAMARVIKPKVQNKANKILGRSSLPEKVTPIIVSDIPIKARNSLPPSTDKEEKRKKKKTLWGTLFGSSSDKEEENAFSQEMVKKEIGEEEFEKLKVFLKVACLDVTVLDDPERGPEIFEFYKKEVFGKQQIEVDREEEYGQLVLEEYEDMYDDVDLPDPDDFSGESGGGEILSTVTQSVCQIEKYAAPDGDILGDVYYEDDIEFESNPIDITGGVYYDDVDVEPLTKNALPQDVKHNPNFASKQSAKIASLTPKKPEKQPFSSPQKDKLDQKPINSPPTTTTGKCKNGQPPPPAPPPPPPAPGLPPPPPSMKKPIKDEKVNVNHAKNTSVGNKGDLLSEIRGAGVGVLKKAAPKVVKDVKSIASNTLSDILGGALAKIKDVNIVYGDEPDLGEDSDHWD